MKFSYQKLQTYFPEPLPAIAELSDTLTLYAFEVDEIEEKEGETILDIKVLPDRAGDAKTELGMAREIGAVLNISLKPDYFQDPSYRLEIPFSTTAINGLLGLSLTTEEVAGFLARERVVVKNDIAQIPADRLDLNITEDLADEVGRLYGVGRLPVTALPRTAVPTQPDLLLEKADRVRQLFLEAGYTEMYGYSLTDHGVREVVKPIAADKGFLRANLLDELEQKISLNLGYVLFDTEPVKLFEIGTVFSAEGESLQVAAGIGYRQAKLKKESLPPFVAEWGGKIETKEALEVVEIELEKINLEGKANLVPYVHLDRPYQPFSLYPRIIRDIAVWVSEGNPPEEVIEVIKNAAGPLLTEGPVLFDEFKKDGRKSLAFRQAFQSREKTLSDGEVNEVMDKVVTALEAKGWEVRK